MQAFSSYLGCFGKLIFEPRIPALFFFNATQNTATPHSPNVIKYDHY